jgi:hypothetical protein
VPGQTAAANEFKSSAPDVNSNDAERYRKFLKKEGVEIEMNSPAINKILNIFERDSQADPNEGKFTA